MEKKIYHSRQYNIHKRGLPTNSSAGFMAAIIAIIIGVIAFAFGLTALILVLLLRSTVNSSLGKSTCFDLLYFLQTRIVFFYIF